MDIPLEQVQRMVTKAVQTGLPIASWVSVAADDDLIYVDKLWLAKHMPSLEHQALDRLPNTGQMVYEAVMAHYEGEAEAPVADAVYATGHKVAVSLHVSPVTVVGYAVSGDTRSPLQVENGLVYGVVICRLPLGKIGWNGSAFFHLSRVQRRFAAEGKAVVFNDSLQSNYWNSYLHLAEYRYAHGQ